MLKHTENKGISNTNLFALCKSHCLNFECMKKRVLFIHHVSSIGGASYCLLSIIKGLDREKMKPVILLKDNGPLVEELNKLDVEIHIYPNIHQVPYNMPMYKLGTLLAYYKISSSLNLFERWLDDKNIDTVYINTMMLYPYLKPAKKKGLKTIIHIREYWPHNEHTKQLKRAQNQILSYADKIIAINNISASIIPRASDKTYIAYDWIDFSNRYEYRPFNEIFGEDCSNLKVYLFTGGVVSLKGGLVIAKTFINCIKDSNARLLMLGVDNELKFEGIKGVIRKFLSFFGVYTRSDQLRLLVETDKRIKCIPSTYAIKHLIEQSYCMLSYFTIPHANLALAESLILGTPTIAAETYESIEYAFDTKLNTFFRINDQLDFVEKIKYLNNHYAEEKAKVKSLSVDIKQRFDKKHNLHTINQAILTS